MHHSRKSPNTHTYISLNFIICNILGLILTHVQRCLQPRTQEMHQLLGVWDSMKSKAVPVMPIVAYGVDGKTEINRVDLYEIEEPTPQVPNVRFLSVSLFPLLFRHLPTPSSRCCAVTGRGRTEYLIISGQLVEPQSREAGNYSS